MIRAPLEPTLGWSRTRLLLSAAVLTAVQFVVVVNVGHVPDPPRALRAEQGEAMLVLDEEQAAVVVAGLPRARLDVFGQDAGDAFQQVALHSVPKAEYRLQEWQEPTRWLTNPAVLVPVRVRAVMESERDLTAARPPVPATAVRSLVSRETLVESHGATVRRGWKKAPVLGPWTGAEVLGATRIDIAVNPQGWVVLAQIVESSGSREADELARQAVRAALMNPLPDAAKRPEFDAARLESGSVTVHWSTQPALR